MEGQHGQGEEPGWSGRPRRVHHVGEGGLRAGSVTGDWRAKEQRRRGKVKI